MYRADNEEELYVVSYKELLFIFFIFSLILFALYPKDLLKQQILSQDTDYELSMTYLQNLILKDPNNPSLKMILAKMAIQKGDLDMALELLEKLQHAKKKKISNEALLLTYEVMKRKYFQTENQKEKRSLRTKMRPLFVTIFTKHLYDTNYKKWYEEATFVQLPNARYHFLQLLIKQNPTDIRYLQDGFYLAQRLHRIKDANRYLDALLRYDTTKHEYWAMAKYYFLVAHKRYGDAEKLLQNEAKQSMKFKKLLADFYLMQQQYTQASQTYLEIMQQSTLQQQKQTFFKKAVNALRAGNYLNAAALLVKKHESEFFHDKSMREFMLKVYMGSGRLDLAHRLAIKILQRNYIR